jgi:hypothetical protein
MTSSEEPKGHAGNGVFLLHRPCISLQRTRTSKNRICSIKYAWFTAVIAPLDGQMVFPTPSLYGPIADHSVLSFDRFGELVRVGSAPFKRSQN